jgi:hypothetical protein
MDKHSRVMADYPAGTPCPACGNRQMLMPIAGRVRSIDYCIGHIVAALNAGGVETVASCCGHGDQPGTIILADGRELIIRRDAYPDLATAKTESEMNHIRIELQEWQRSLEQREQALEEPHVKGE